MLLELFLSFPWQARSGCARKSRIAVLHLFWGVQTSVLLPMVSNPGEALPNSCSGYSERALACVAQVVAHCPMHPEIASSIL